MITRIKTKKIIQSIVYCLSSTAVYCLLYIAHWAKFGQQVDVMSLEITWYQMIPNDITWCSMTLHGALLHHITMISCYITCWWYPVTLHDDDTLFNHMMSSDITFHVKKVGGGCSSCWLPHCKGPQDSGFRKCFGCGYTAAASLLYSSRGMQGHVFWGRQVDFRVQGRTITQLVSWKIMLQVPGSADKT